MSEFLSFNPEAQLSPVQETVEKNTAFLETAFLDDLIADLYESRIPDVDTLAARLASVAVSSAFGTECARLVDAYREKEALAARAVERMKKRLEQMPNPTGLPQEERLGKMLFGQNFLAPKGRVVFARSGPFFVLTPLDERDMRTMQSSEPSERLSAGVAFDALSVRLEENEIYEVPTIAVFLASVQEQGTDSVESVLRHERQHTLYNIFSPPDQRHDTALASARYGLKDELLAFVVDGSAASDISVLLTREYQSLYAHLSDDERSEVKEWIQSACEALMVFDRHPVASRNRLCAALLRTSFEEIPACIRTQTNDLRARFGDTESD